MLDAEIPTQTMDPKYWFSFKPGIRPVGHRVLVYVIPTERKTKGGIVVPESVADKQDLRQVKARVMAVGLSTWKDTVDGTPWAEVGDTVLIAKFAGHVVDGDDGRKYRLINDLDITAVCRDPEDPLPKEEDSADFVAKMVEQLEETENA